MRVAILLLGLSSTTPLAFAQDDGDQLFRVVDAHTGKGIPRVGVYDVSDPGSVLRQYWPFAGNSPAIGRSDGSGVVRATRWFGGFPDRKTALLTAADYDSAVIDLPEGASSQETLEVFRLEPLRGFEGRVLESNGTPAADGLEVVVTAWLPNDTRASALSVRQASFATPPPEFIAHVAGEGRFGPLSVPRAALLTVHVRDPLTHFEGEPIVLAKAGPLKATEILLPERATLCATIPSGRGRVALFGAGYGGGPELRILDNGDQWETALGAEVAAGELTTLARLLPGRILVGHDLDVGASWFARLVTLTAGATSTVELGAPDVRPIRGRVLGADGKPLVEADVAWYVGPDGGSFVHSTRTSRDGTFILAGVLAGHGTGRVRVRSQGPSVNPFAAIAPPSSDGEGPRTRISMYNSNGLDSPFAVVDGVRPGSEVEIVVPEICVGLLDVHVEGGEGEGAMTWLARHDGREPEASGEQWCAPIALGPKVLLSRHALEPGRYRVLVERTPGAAWTAEADVTVEAGRSTRVDLTLARTGTLELRPPSGCRKLTVVQLLRGDVPLARLWLNPVVPTALALAEGELTVEWELPGGTPHRRAVRIVPGETVSVAIGT